MVFSKRLHIYLMVFGPPGLSFSHKQDPTICLRKKPKGSSEDLLWGCSCTPSFRWGFCLRFVDGSEIF